MAEALGSDLETLSDVNRYAVVVRPALPFILWLQAIDPTPGAILPNEKQEASVYLLPYVDDSEPPETVLERQFRPIFEEQLFGWWTDTSDWPDELTWEMFQRWFHCELTTSVFDLSRKPLRRTYLV